MSCKYLGQSKVFVGECNNQTWRGTLTGPDNTITLEYDSKSIEVPLIVLEELLHAIYEVDPMVSSGSTGNETPDSPPSDECEEMADSAPVQSLPGTEPVVNVPSSRPAVKMDNSRKIKPRV